MKAVILLKDVILVEKDSFRTIQILYKDREYPHTIEFGDENTAKKAFKEIVTAIENQAYAVTV
jgi:hypothetical protein